MSGLACLIKDNGAKVSGCDRALYHPTDTLLSRYQIQWQQNPDISELPDAHHYVVGNVNSRGQPIVEHLLNQRASLIAAPALIREVVDRQRQMITVAGTHGKTTTTSLIAHVLQQSKQDPGWLIAGDCQSPNTPCNLGTGPFVIEADEYDSAFFDKRPKFLHYRPTIALINNIEFDHADIYSDLDDILQQFHYYLRQVPANGHVLIPADDSNCHKVLDMGCWSPVTRFSTAVLPATSISSGSSGNSGDYGNSLALAGQHNKLNLAAAYSVCKLLGISDTDFTSSISSFKGVARRLDQFSNANDVRYIEDFAHHPTAIRLTLETLKETTKGKLLAAVDLASNTMRSGYFANELPESVASADRVFWWGTDSTNTNTIEDLATTLIDSAEPGDTVVILSNSHFDGLKQLLIQAVKLAPDSTNSLS